MNCTETSNYQAVLYDATSAASQGFDVAGIGMGVAVAVATTALGVLAYQASQNQRVKSFAQAAWNFLEGNCAQLRDRVQPALEYVAPTSVDKALGAAAGVGLAAGIITTFPLAAALGVAVVAGAALGFKRKYDIDTAAVGAAQAARENAFRDGLASFDQGLPVKFDQYAGALKIEDAAKTTQINADTPPPTIEMSEDNGIVAAVLQSMVTPFYMERLPQTIAPYLIEHQLFPDGVKEVYRQNPGLSEPKRAALVQIGVLLRHTNGEINNEGLDTLTRCLGVLSRNEAGENDLPLNGVNRQKVKELCVLLMLRASYNGSPTNISADAVKNLYWALRNLNPKIPPKMSKCSPLNVCKTISTLMEKEPGKETEHTVRFIEKPIADNGSDQSFTYEPEQIVVVMKGDLVKLNKTTRVVTALDGSETTYRAKGYLTWKPGATHATATVTRREGLLKGYKWTHCDNNRAEQNRGVKFDNLPHLEKAYMVFSSKVKSFFKF